MFLEVKNGCFSYGAHTVLENINMSVEQHDVYAVLGRNGVGKTTLLKCIMRILPWRSGYAALDGTDLRKLSRKKMWQEISYVPQAKGCSDIPVRDMVVMGRSPHIGTFSKPNEQDYAIADEILDRLYITHLREKPCNQLSGGELQLVLIGRALSARPRLLIMDEPESNLDYHNQMHILGLIRELSKDTACILNTHYPEHALRYADKALMLCQDGTGISGAAEQVITESNLRMAFGIDVCIGTHRIGSNDYKYIIPMH